MPGLSETHLPNGSIQCETDDTIWINTVDGKLLVKPKNGNFAGITFQRMGDRVYRSIEVFCDQCIYLFPDGTVCLSNDMSIE